MMNKAMFEKKLTALAQSAESPVVPCTKLAIDNVIFPAWQKLGKIFSLMFAQVVKTAEQPTGNHYDEEKYQSLFRVIDGRILFDDARREADGKIRLDNYCWTKAKVQKYVDGNKAATMNTRTAEGQAVIDSFLKTIKSEEEREMVSDLFNMMNVDFLLVNEPENNRFCIRITQELYDAGWTSCVDEWMDTDNNGDANETELFVGDALIINYKEDGTVTGYRVDKKIFELTYSV